MRGRWMVVVLLLPIVAVASGMPAVRWYDEGVSDRVEVPPLPQGQRFTTVRIEDVISYIRYLFEPKQGLLLPSVDDPSNPAFYFAYNDNATHVRTKIFYEDQLMDPASWIVQDIVTWTGGGDLRYVSPSAYFDGSLWYPQATFNSYAPSYCAYMYDEGGLGAGTWTAPIPITGVYDAYLPLTETSPGNIVHMDAQARDVASDSHIYRGFDGWTGTVVDPPGEVPIFVDTVVWGQGYENSQVLYRDGRMVICLGGFRDSTYTDPENPLLVVYDESFNDGLTWSDTIWVDQTLVPDMPGSIPGIHGHWSNSFFDGLIDMNGKLHFLAVIADSGYYGNTSFISGMYDLHETAMGWTATLVSDGIYQITPDSTFNPREFLGGDTYMHSPSLAEAPDGHLFAAWDDIGEIVGTTAYMDAWVSHSWDGGETWEPAIKATETLGISEYFSRLIPTGSDSNMYLITMPTGGANGPLDMIQLPNPPLGVPVLTGTVAGTMLTLSWNAIVDAAAYRVYQSATPWPQAGDVMVLVDEVATTALNIDLSGLGDGAHRYYVVRAAHGIVLSGASNVVGAYQWTWDIP